MLLAALPVMNRWQTPARCETRAGMLCAVGSRRFVVPYSNAAVLADGGADPAAALDAAQAVFDDRRFLLWVRAASAEGTADAALQRLAVERGYALWSTPRSMVLTDVQGAPSSGIETRTVEDGPSFATFVELCAAAYEELGLPGAVTRDLLAVGDAVLDDDNVHAVLGARDGVAVGTALAILKGDIAGVYWVGTHPQSRRSGAGQACTRAVVDWALSRGANGISLEASDGGLSLYEKMGFQLTPTWKVLRSP